MTKVAASIFDKGWWTADVWILDLVRGTKTRFTFGPVFANSPLTGLLENYPQLVGTVGDRDWCISFRWGGDMNECACVLAASAALVKLCDAVAYYPDDNLSYDLNSLLEEAKRCF